MHDEWIIGEGATSGEWYVTHAMRPRFLARIEEIEEGDGAIELVDVEWFDPLPGAAEAARLARRAGEVLDRYDTRRLEGETLGERIRSARQNVSLSVATVAEEIGVAANTVYRWETDTMRPEMATLEDLAAILGVSAGWLLDGG